ncbi:DNA-methyltransferase [Haloferax volcanii]|uniref:DNA-methyltransferase n=1 Tax=Haloferax volcanii TaxID=2246 RepID=UPI00385F22FC
MTKKETRREIKPRSEVPASYEEIVQDVPDRSIDTNLASNLSGMRSAHFKKVVREGFDETISSTTSLQTVAKVFARSRPSPSILSQKHFTTEEGQEGLLDLIDFVETREGEDGSPDDLEKNQILHGSAYDHFHEIPTESIQTVVTSPPYWGMRVYSEEFDIQWSDGTEVAFGGESTPEDYIRHTIETFWKLRPLLTDTGTIWWNVGDVYNTRTQIRADSLERMDAVKNGEEITWAERNAKRHSAGHEYLRDKDLTLIPYQIAKGLQRSGFWVRSVITWEKENVVPETVQDRPTVGHETILLVSKSKRYQFDEQAWRDSNNVGKRGREEPKNLRTVWKFNTAPGKDAHGAPFPVDLPGRCITLATDHGDVIYDPFLGSGTTAVAASKLDRPWIGSEIADKYIDIINERLENETSTVQPASESSLDQFMDES